MSACRFKVVDADEGHLFNVFGSSMVFKATAEDTGGAFSLAVETTAPRAGLPLHVHHREDEAMYILEGDFEIECGGEVRRICAGAFVLLPRGIPNRYQNVGETPGKFLYFTSPGGFERLVEKTSALMCDGHPDMQKVAEAGRERGVEFV